MITTSINGLTFSKVVLGTNALYGRSHFSEARSKEYETRCTDEYIMRLIETCMEFGVNAVESSANERVSQWLAAIQPRAKTPFRFIGNTRQDATSAMTHREKLEFLVEHRADICVIHAQFVDRPRRGNDIRGLRELVDRIHAEGLVAGISTHKISTVELCEERDYGVDTYLFPLNATGFVFPGYGGTETAKQRAALVRRVPKPFILMKTLGAGRIAPVDGLRFALDNSKDIDMITLGLSSIEEAEESLSLVKELLDGD